MTNTKQVANGKLDLTADGGEIGVPVAWGRYRLEIESAPPPKDPRAPSNSTPAGS